MEGRENVFVNQEEIVSQDNISKLAKDLTGLSLDDPKMINRFFDDYEKINDKYDLPYMSLLFKNPTAYYKNLKSVLDENNIPLYKQSSTDEFFKKNPEAIACYFSKVKYILINETSIENNDSTGFLILSVLTHETIHALQDKRNYQMSIEEKEYEAHIGSLPFSSLKDNSKKITVNVMGIFNEISQSVEIYNRQMSQLIEI